MWNSLLLSSALTLKKQNRLGYYIIRGLHGPEKVNEYSARPLYPPISNFRTETEKRAAKAKEMVRNLETVEEKMYQINRPKYYGWYSYILKPDYVPVDILDFSKFSTWTTVVNSLPDYFKDKQLQDQADTILSQIGGLVEQVIKNEHCYRELGFNVTNDRLHYREKFAVGPGTKCKAHLEDKTSRNIIKKIHEVIQSHLALSQQHIRDSVEDYDARNEGFWFRGGVIPDKCMLKKKEGVQKHLEKKAKQGYQVKEMSDEEVNEPYERCLQVKHSSVVQVRYKDPLREFVSRDDPISTNINVPIANYDPRTYGFKAVCQHGTNIPGYWPEDSNQMGLLAYHTRVNEYNYMSVGKSILTEQIEREQDLSKGILSNFAWLLPQACHLGFSPMTELTYPLVSQSVNTDGRTWSFFAYQMNTCDLSPNDFSEHTHQNIIWAPEPVQLYSEVKDGSVVNYTPEVLKPLIMMYLNKPSCRNYDMTPYLGAVKNIVDFPDDYQRNQLLSKMRQQLSNRPKKLAKPEMYMWEKVLLVDNLALPELGLARRRRWWHMYKIDPLGKENWHPEFVTTDEKRDKYLAKGTREPWTRKGQLNRRYNKFAPRLQIPLKEKIAVFQLPDSKYKGEPDD